MLSSPLIRPLVRVIWRSGPRKYRIPVPQVLQSNLGHAFGTQGFEVEVYHTITLHKNCCVAVAWLRLTQTARGGVTSGNGGITENSKAAARAV